MIKICITYCSDWILHIPMYDLSEDTLSTITQITLISLYRYNYEILDKWNTYMLFKCNINWWIPI